MYKDFSSLDDLYVEVQSDKNWDGAESSFRNRYPIRFVLFESFSDFGGFVQVCQDHGVFVQSIDNWMEDEQDDQLITYTELKSKFDICIKNKPANDFVIAPFSEITRFYDNVRYSEFDALVKTIRLIQSPEESQREHQRIYVPIIGMQGKMGKFMDDPNIHIWEYHSGQERDNYRLILTRGTTYGVKGLERKYTLCNNLRQWISLWKNVEGGIKSHIICSSNCLFANAGNAQPDNAFDYVVCNNAFEFLQKGLGLNFERMMARNCDFPFWEKLASQIDVTDFNFEDFVRQHFNASNLSSEESFAQAWFEYNDEFSRWLLKTYYLWKAECRNYLVRVLENVESQSSSELFSLIATQIFDEPYDEESLNQRLILLNEARKENVAITSMAEQKVRAKLSVMAADPERGTFVAMKYMTPLTLSEQCLMIVWLGRGKIEKESIRKLYPALCDYLSESQLTKESGKAWINKYFLEYRFSKIANEQTELLGELLKKQNASQLCFENWRNCFKTVKTFLYNREDIDIYYWIDGLGVDWIPFIKKVIEKHKVDGVYLNEIYVATAELPTTTSVNKEKLDELSKGKLEKIGDIDQFAHTQKSYPEYLEKEFRLVEEAISKVLSKYNGKKIAFVSDHGISYMAQYGQGLNLAGIETNHSGRCGKWGNGLAPSDTNYVITEGGQTLSSLNYNSLSTKTPKGQGAHGGATPEEVLVPIIIVSNQKNANTYSAKLQSSDIAANHPVVTYEIKGLNSIDSPVVIYNDVEYALHNITGDTYESDRLTLVATSTRITLRIGDFKQTDSLHINIGAEEDDLLSF